MIWQLLSVELSRISYWWWTPTAWFLMGVGYITPKGKTYALKNLDWFVLKQTASTRARKFKKVQAKKLVKSNKSKFFFREIAFLAVLNFFPVQKLIFGHFWNCKKWNLVKKIFSSNCIFGIFKLFPTSKIDFWPFLKLQNIEFG